MQGLLLPESYGSEGKNALGWTRENTVYGTLIRNEGGKNLGIAGDVPVIEKDGYAFKDLARTGELLPYEARVLLKR